MSIPDKHRMDRHRTRWNSAFRINFRRDIDLWRAKLNKLFFQREMKTMQSRKWRKDSKNIINSKFSGISTLNCRISEKQNKRIIHTSKFDVSDIEYFFPNHSYCKSVQYLRNSFELTWTVWLTEENKKKLEKNTSFLTKSVLTSAKLHEIQPFFSIPEIISENCSHKKQSRLREVLSETIRFSKNSRRGHRCRFGFSHDEITTRDYKNKLFPYIN